VPDYYRWGWPRERAVTDTAPTVYERLVAVFAELPAIGKNSRAPQQMGGYPFRGIEDITAALRPLLAKHGLLYRPRTLERRDSEWTTGNGKVLHVVDVHVEFTFVDLTGGTVAGDAWGQGSDSGDKATQKAYTSALKTFLSQTFCISEAEYDAERHDVPDTRPKAASKARIDAAKAEAADAGIGDWVKDQGFPWPWTDEACDAIEAKAREGTEPF
jgi:hypothetical protein